MITYGTNPGMGMPVRDPVPDPAALTNRSDRSSVATGPRLHAASNPARPLLGHPVEVVFVGSCTNSRLSDLRDAARIIEGRKVNDKVRMLVVPGSQRVKRRGRGRGPRQDLQDRRRRVARTRLLHVPGHERRQLEPGQLSVSTSNRNFEGRQGPNAAGPSWRVR